ncbi:hypothetical protein [Nocardia sp. NPDC052566]|uniref:hypothetical protein n=1 Tax=Nocardia sp. NPDC052566 TaxID=3364330 RepID=UPI0037C505BB
MTISRNSAARIAAAAAVVFAGFLGVAPAMAGPFDTGSSLPAPGNLGPFEYEHQCLARGNQGIEKGEWRDFDCVGSYGAWRVVPRY